MAFARRQLVVGLALVLLTWIAYGRVGSLDFVNYDDGMYVTDNPAVQAGLSGRGWRWAWTTLTAGYWQPLTWLSLQLDAQIHGLRPAGYHWTNLLLHVASVVLLFGVLHRLTGAFWRCALVAALFGLHPLHVESVAWVAERKDVLSTFFWILTLGAYVGYAERPSVGRYLVVVAVFALGLLAKPMLVTLPCVLLLLDCWPLRRYQLWGKFSTCPDQGQLENLPHGLQPLWWLLVEKLPLLALTAVACVLTVYAQHQAGAVQPLAGLTLGERVGNALVSYVWYITKTIWPTGLALLYPHPQDTLPVWKVASAALLLTGISALVARQAPQRPWQVVGWLWFLGTLVPVIGLVQVGEQARADRFTYVPHIGLFLFAVWTGADILNRWHWSARTQAIVVGTLLAGFTICTWIQVGYWRNSVTVWERTLQVTRDNYRAHFSLGLVFLHQGKWERAQKQFAEALRLEEDSSEAHFNMGVALFDQGDLEGAADQYQSVIRLSSDYASAYHNLGVVRLRQGRLEESRKYFTRALELRPGAADTHNSLGITLWQLRQADEAAAQLRAALEVQPTFAEAHNNLGVICLARGRTQEAIDHFNDAVRNKETFADAHNNLGVALGRLARWEEARQSFAQAVQLQPVVVPFRCNLALALHQGGHAEAANEQYREALALDPTWPGTAATQAWTLATDPDQRVRDAAQALELALQACQATGDRRPDFLDALAAAHAAAGHFAEARRVAQEALALATSRQRTKLAELLRHRLRLYEQDQPFRRSPSPSGEAAAH
jgi:tetratricopeptide (TPR) repeat protein